MTFTSTSSSNEANIHASQQGLLNMVQGQIKPCDVSDPRVLSALLQIPRVEFAAPAYRGLCNIDKEIPDVAGGVLPRPLVLGRLLQALSLSANSPALVVGCHSVYVAAVMACMGASVTCVLPTPEECVKAKDQLYYLQVSLEVVSYSEFLTLPNPKLYEAVWLDGVSVNFSEQWLARVSMGGRVAGLLVQPNQLVKGVIMTRHSNEWATRPLFEYLSDIKTTPQFVF